MSVSKKSYTVLAFSLVLAVSQLATAASAPPQASAPRHVAPSEELQLTGVVLNRDGEQFTLRQQGPVDTIVLLTAATSISCASLRDPTNGCGS